MTKRVRSSDPQSGAERWLQKHLEKQMFLGVLLGTTPLRAGEVYIRSLQMCTPFGPEIQFLGIYHKEIIENVLKDF